MLPIHARGADNEHKIGGGKEKDCEIFFRNVVFQVTTTGKSRLRRRRLSRPSVRAARLRGRQEKEKRVKSNNFPFP